jgi:tetraacyldisaccharide 4'-kinase
MNPLAALFGAVVAGRNVLYDRGLLRMQRLQRPVISVGNLSVGGAGKTPFVILLGELLKTRGIRFDVLTRGYGRQSGGVAQVDPNGSARIFGDEPLLIARRLGVPVIVGSERYQAGIFAEGRFASHVHLLDDGFQHRQLARDFDIVLVTAEDARDRLLPAGRLRESVSALERADAVVLPADLSCGQLPLAGKQVWRLRRNLQAGHAPPRPVGFCGIARPGNFFSQLREAGVELAAEVPFPDHHVYTRRDVSRLLRLRQQTGAGGFVTTEKDAVKLDALLAELQPVAVVPVIMELVDAQAAVDNMLVKIEHRNSSQTSV